jgi:hypothetical protein
VETILLSIALVLSIAWLIIRIRQGKTDVKSDTAKKLAHEKVAYHAVSISIEKKACEAAKAMTGRRFLSDAAPLLPLRDCDVADCRCKFTHHADRREKKDRRSPFAPGGYSANPTGTHERDRRARKDRRDDPDFDAF